MAEKNSDAPKPKAYRGTKPPRKDLPPAEIRELAHKLSDFARRIHDVAREMERFGIPDMRPGLGNFNTAVDKVEAAIEKELELRLKAIMRKKGKKLREQS